MTHRLWLTALLALSLAAFSSCKEEGPMEKAGRKLDETVEKLTEDKGPMEELGETLDDAVEDLGDAVEDFGE